MSNYTLEVRQLIENGLNVFDLPYKFYDDDLKEEFETLFINHYYYHEIGFETVFRFNQRLSSRLNMKYDYYRQLYETQLKAQKIEFLLNKDLKETFIKEIVRETESENQINSEGRSVLNSDNQNKESNLDNGNASLDFDSLTSVSHETGNNVSSENSNATNVNSANVREIEKTENLSQGNIGITSSAELLEKWRKVLLNLNELIIEECSDLFMQVY